MLRSLRLFLNRPLAEDFGFANQVRQSVLSGVYVFAFVYLFGGGHYMGWTRAGLLALFGFGCTVSALFANWFVPSRLPALYDEERWTAGKQVLQILLVLFCVSTCNQLMLWLLGMSRPAFWQMYVSVTLIGFFPISVSLFVSEQRRLRRNLLQAQQLNEQLSRLPMTGSVNEINPPRAADPTIQLTSDNGRDRLNLFPDQLRYVESVGNYADVYWLHNGTMQKTALRSTLKDIETTLAGHPTFFRCHRAYLVNLRSVSHTDGNARGYQLALTDVPVRIPVSRTYLTAFDDRFNQVSQPAH